MGKTKVITKISDVRPQVRNSNRHTQRGLGLLESSIQADGWIGAMTIAADGETFDGSARAEVGVAAGFDDAIVVDSDGSRPVIVRRIDIPNADDKRAKRLGVAANRIAQIDFDPDLEVLAELVDEGIEINDLYSDEEMAEMLAGIELPESEEGAGGDEFDTEPDEKQTRVQYGDLWQCGEHRVLCGDSTKAEDVARLMDGEKADMLVTDPPYNVDYVGKTKEALVISNDSMNDGQFREFLFNAVKLMFDSIKPGAAYYIWHADSEGYNFRGAVQDNQQKVRQCLVWVKNSLVMGRQDYHWQHEPCLYGWKDGASHNWFADRKQTTLLEFDRPSRSEEHPTMKPIPLFSYLMNNSSRQGELVLDTFLGSGTTLIAAERTKRKCYGIEISPKYVNVILNRWEAETGKTAELIERKE